MCEKSKCEKKVAEWRVETHHTMRMLVGVILLSNLIFWVGFAAVMWFIF